MLNDKRYGRLLVARVFPAASNFALAACGGYFLSAADYAVFSTSLIAITAIGLLVFGWLGQLLMRFASIYEAQALQHLYAVIIRSYFALAVLVLFIAAAMVIQTQSASQLLIAVGALAFGAHTAFLYASQARLSVGRTLKMEAARSALCLVLPFLVFVFSDRGSGAITAIVAYILALFIAPLYMSLAGLKTNLPEQRWNEQPVPPDVWRSMLGYGIPVSAWMGVCAGLPYIDRHIGLLVIPAAAIGQYALLYDLTARSLSALVAPVMYLTQQGLYREYQDHGWTSRYTGLLLNASLKTLLVGACAALIIYGAGYVLEEVVGFRKLGLMQSPATYWALMTGSLIWQLGFIAQKPLESLLRPVLMLLALIIAVLLFPIGMNLLMLNGLSVAQLAINYAFGGVIYLILVIAFALLIERSRKRAA